MSCGFRITINGDVIHPKDYKKFGITNEKILKMHKLSNIKNQINKAEVGFVYQYTNGGWHGGQVITQITDKHIFLGHISGTKEPFCKSNEISNIKRYTKKQFGKLSLNSRPHPEYNHYGSSGSYMELVGTVVDLTKYTIKS
jgi:hypothetical protein